MIRPRTIDLRFTQLSLRDCVCITCLLAVVIGGITDRVHHFPKVASYVTREVVYSPMPGIADVTRVVHLSWYSVLVGGFVVGATAVIGTFMTFRLFFRKASPLVCQPLSRLAASVATVIVAAVFWLVAMAVLHGNYSQVFESELESNLVAAMRSRGVIVAATMTGFIAFLELVGLAITRHHRIAN